MRPAPRRAARVPPLTTRPSTSRPTGRSTAERPMADDNDLLQATLAHVLKACDIVSGPPSIVLARIGRWSFARGDLQTLTLAALWWIPVFNSTFSAATKRRRRITADLIRGAVCLPV